MRVNKNVSDDSPNTKTYLSPTPKKRNKQSMFEDLERKWPPRQVVDRNSDIALRNNYDDYDDIFKDKLETFSQNGLRLNNVDSPSQL